MKEFIGKTIDKAEERIKVTSLEIIVTGTKDKPYFEIKYKKVGKEDYSIGYSSYDLNNVFCWKEECFEIVNQLAEEYNNGWILTEESLPDNNRCVLIKAESTTIAGGTIIAVGACHNGFWFVQSGLDTLSFPCNGYKVVKWRELPKE